MPGNSLSNLLPLGCAALLLVGCSADAPMPVGPEETRTAAAGLNATSVPAAASAQPLVSGLQGSIGSTIGPGGALFVAEGLAGRISRIDPKTGEVTTFARGLPSAILPIGGPIDVAFYGGTAYALVTLVGSEFDTDDVVGIYRIDGPDSYTVIADIGAFNLANPPTGFSFGVGTGLQYAIEAYRGGFLVSDGHLNRVLHVTRDGAISIFRQFDNIVPTGLEVRGNTVYMAAAGPEPHLPEEGRIVAFGPGSASASVVAAGAPLLVDVKFGRGNTIFGLAQGIWDVTRGELPALPNTGSLVRVSGDGGFIVIAEGLDRPTSFQFIGNTAYVVTLTGEIWRIDNVAAPPFGASR